MNNYFEDDSLSVILSRQTICNCSVQPLLCCAGLDLSNEDQVLVYLRVLAKKLKPNNPIYPSFLALEGGIMGGKGISSEAALVWDKIIVELLKSNPDLHYLKLKDSRDKMLGFVIVRK